VSSSGALMSLIGRVPISGLAKPISHRSFSRVFAARPSASFFFSHSSATVANVSPAEMLPTPRVSLP